VFAPPKVFMDRLKKAFNNPNSQANQPVATAGGGMMGNPNYYTDGSSTRVDLSPPFVMDNDRNQEPLGGGYVGGFGNLQDLIGRVGQQTGQMQGGMAQTTIHRAPPRQRYSPIPDIRGPQRRITQGPESMNIRLQRPMPSRPDIRQSQRRITLGPELPMRVENSLGPELPMRNQVGYSPSPRQRMPQPNQGYGNRFPGMQFSGPFSQPMMPQNYGMGGGYRQPPMMPQYPQPRMPYLQPMPQPGYGGGYGGGFGGRGPGGGYGNMYAQQPQMYGGGYPPQPPMFGGGYGGGYGQQPQYGGGFGGGMQGGYGGGMGGMYNQPQRQLHLQNAGPSPFGGQMNQRQQQQQMAQQMGGGFQQMGGFGGGIMRSFY